MKNHGTEKVLVKNSHGYHVINADDILYCKSMGSYTVIYLLNNEKVLSFHLLKEVEDQLPSDDFYRVNRSILINLNCIKCYKTNPHKSIVMENQEEFKIAIRKNSNFITQLRKKFRFV